MRVSIFAGRHDAAGGLRVARVHAGSPGGSRCDGGGEGFLQQGCFYPAREGAGTSWEGWCWCSPVAPRSGKATHAEASSRGGGGGGGDNVAFWVLLGVRGSHP